MTVRNQKPVSANELIFWPAKHRAGSRTIAFQNRSHRLSGTGVWDTKFPDSGMRTPPSLCQDLSDPSTSVVSLFGIDTTSHSRMTFTVRFMSGNSGRYGRVALLCRDPQILVKVNQIVWSFLRTGPVSVKET